MSDVLATNLMLSGLLLFSTFLPQSASPVTRLITPLQSWEGFGAMIIVMFLA